jgi:ferredoxin
MGTEPGVLVTVDAELCCGSGQCVLSMPDIFGQSADDGTVVLYGRHFPMTLHTALADVAVRCTTRAIAVA